MSNVETLVPVVGVKVNGQPLAIATDSRIISIHVERSVAACDRFEIRFDVWEDESPIASIGDDITISLAERSATTELLSAEVTAKAIEVRPGSRILVVSGLDRRHTLMRTIGTRGFVDTTLAAVVKKLAGEHGLQLKDQTSGALGRTTYPHILHAGSDFEMLQHIARRVGAEWLIDGTDLIFRTISSTSATVTLSPERDLVAFHVRYSPVERTDEVTVYGWDAAKGEPIVGSAPGPTSMHSFKVSSEEAKKLGSATARSWSAPMISSREADDAASAIGRRLVESSVTGYGETLGTPALVPGGFCKVDDVGRDFSGTYHVTSVEHSFGGNLSFRTRFRIGSLEPESLVDLFGGRNVTTPGQVFNGVTIGVVTNNEHPDGRTGVVKVKLPYLGDKVESDWARLTSIGSGAGRGVVFVPEVDDEVLVAFEHGDVGRPYVLGTLSRGTKDAAYDKKVKSGKVAERSIVSRLGNRIRFLDAEHGDRESGFAIEVDDNKTRLFFGYQKTELITEGRPLELKNGAASVLLKDGKVTITADEITLKSNTGDVILGATNVKIDGRQGVAVSGARLELKGQAQATLEASGVTMVKGSIVKVN